MKGDHGNMDSDPHIADLPQNTLANDVSNLKSSFLHIYIYIYCGILVDNLVYRLGTYSNLFF